MTFAPAFIRLPARRAALAVACAAALSAGPAARAQSPAAEASHVGIGVAVGTRGRPYAQLDHDTSVLPLLSYDSARVHVAGLGAELALAAAGGVEAGLRLQYTQDGYDSSDSPVFSGMADRKRSVLFGPVARWRGGPGTLSLSVLGDVSSHSRGLQSTLAWNRAFHAGPVLLTPHLAATWSNGRYVDYYYGVAADEATAARPAYTPGGSVDVVAGLRGALPLARRQSLFVDVAATAFGAPIQDSPLVDRSVVAAFQLGYLYRF